MGESQAFSTLVQRCLSEELRSDVRQALCPSDIHDPDASRVDQLLEAKPLDFHMCKSRQSTPGRDEASVTAP